jgi:DNA-binding NarL/FixJ family response regulator
MLFRPTNLAILDHQILFRKALRYFLSETGNFNIPIEASDVESLLKELNRKSVDVLLFEAWSSSLKGNDVVQTIREKHPKIKILLLSAGTDIHLISALLDSGIHGYVSKSDDPEELVRAIQTVMENRIYRNALLTEALYWNKENSAKVYLAKSPAVLEDRERKILQLLWEEKSNKEIADELFLGIRTVERIRQDMKEKIGVRSTIGLIKFALHSNILTGMSDGQYSPQMTTAAMGHLNGKHKTTF